MLNPPRVDPELNCPPPNRLERRSKATSFEAVVVLKKCRLGQSWRPLFVPFQNPHPTRVPSSPAAPKLRRMLREMT